MACERMNGAPIHFVWINGNYTHSLSTDSDKSFFVVVMENAWARNERTARVTAYIVWQEIGRRLLSLSCIQHTRGELSSDKFQSCRLDASHFRRRRKVDKKQKKNENIMSSPTDRFFGSPMTYRSSFVVAKAINYSQRKQILLFESCTHTRLCRRWTEN